MVGIYRHLDRGKHNAMIWDTSVMAAGGLLGMKLQFASQNVVQSQQFLNMERVWMMAAMKRVHDALCEMFDTIIYNIYLN